MANKDHNEYMSYFKDVKTLTTIDIPNQPNSIKGKDLRDKLNSFKNIDYKESIEEAIRSIPIKENQISKQGIKFRAANGTPIAVHGERNLNGVNNQWSTVGMKAQLADVDKVLGSVYQMCKAGNEVIFDINA